IERATVFVGSVVWIYGTRSTACRIVVVDVYHGDIARVGRGEGKQTPELQWPGSGTAGIGSNEGSRIIGVEFRIRVAANTGSTDTGFRVDDGRIAINEVHVAHLPCKLNAVGGLVQNERRASQDERRALAGIRRDVEGHDTAGGALGALFHCVNETLTGIYHGAQSDLARGNGGVRARIAQGIQTRGLGYRAGISHIKPVN